MKFLKLALIIFALLPVTGLAKNAPETAADYYEALKVKDYKTAAEFFDPAALKEFREMMGFLLTLPEQTTQPVNEAFFGPGATNETIAKLSDLDYFSTFLRSIMTQAEAVGALNFDGMEILGEVSEGKDVSHVVTRNKVTAGEIHIEAMEIISLKKRGKVWKVMLSGKLKGIANQLRTALNRPK